MLTLALALLAYPNPIGPFSTLESKEPDSAAIELTLDAAAADELRRLVLPGPSELTWEAIDWIPSFHAGLETAAAREMPVLLWVMNGHPLGCT